MTRKAQPRPTVRELIGTLDAFNDSQEIADGCRQAARALGSRGYYPTEAAVHIEGLYRLACLMAHELQRREAT